MHNLLRNIFLSASGDKIELKGCYWSETIRKYFWYFCISTPKQGTKMWHIYAYVNRNTTTKSLSSLATWYHPTMERALDSPPPTDWHRFSFFFLTFPWTGEATMPLRLHASPPLRGGQTLQYRRMKGGLYEWLQAPGSKCIEEAGREKLKEGAADINSSRACIIATPGPGAVQGGQRCTVYHYKVPS